MSIVKRHNYLVRYVFRYVFLVSFSYELSCYLSPLFALFSLLRQAEGKSLKGRGHTPSAAFCTFIYLYPSISHRFNRDGRRLPPPASLPTGSVEFPRKIRKWAPVTRAFQWKPFSGATTGCGCAQRRRGGDAHFRSFLTPFFLWSSPRSTLSLSVTLPLSLSLSLSFFLSPSLRLAAKIGEEAGWRGGKGNTASWSPPPFLKRRPLAKCEHVLVCVCPSRICMSACHLRRQLVLFDPVAINLGYQIRIPRDIGGHFAMIKDRSKIGECNPRCANTSLFWSYLPRY